MKKLLVCALSGDGAVHERERLGVRTGAERGD